MMIKFLSFTAFSSCAAMQLEVLDPSEKLIFDVDKDTGDIFKDAFRWGVELQEYLESREDVDLEFDDNVIQDVYDTFLDAIQGPFCSTRLSVDGAKKFTRFVTNFAVGVGKTLCGSIDDVSTAAEQWYAQKASIGLLSKREFDKFNQKICAQHDFDRED